MAQRQWELRGISQVLLPRAVFAGTRMPVFIMGDPTTGARAYPHNVLYISSDWYELWAHSQGCHKHVDIFFISYKCIIVKYSITSSLFMIR